MQNMERIINKKRTALQCKDTDILDMLIHVFLKNADEVWMFKGQSSQKRKSSLCLQYSQTYQTTDVGEFIIFFHSISG